MRYWLLLRAHRATDDQLAEGDGGKLKIMLSVAQYLAWEGELIFIGQTLCVTPRVKRETLEIVYFASRLNCERGLAAAADMADDDDIITVQSQRFKLPAREREAAQHSMNYSLDSRCKLRISREILFILPYFLSHLFLLLLLLLIHRLFSWAIYCEYCHFCSRRAEHWIDSIEYPITQALLRISMDEQNGEPRVDGGRGSTLWIYNQQYSQAALNSGCSLSLFSAVRSFVRSVVGKLRHIVMDWSTRRYIWSLSQGGMNEKEEAAAEEELPHTSFVVASHREE